MKVRELTLVNFRGFPKLSIGEIPATARLVVLLGPNGSGKSTVFDAFLNFARESFSFAIGYDPLYYNHGVVPGGMHSRSIVQFHSDHPPAIEDKKRVFYVRSAYRNEADFDVNTISRQGKLSDIRPVSRLVDTDASVSRNFQWLVGLTTSRLFDGSADHQTVPELRDAIIGKVRASLLAVYPDLELKGLSNPFERGTFYFCKDGRPEFHYKNLSGGEKAVFDLLLDLAIRSEEFQNTVFCIDEPEAHLSTKVQATLLRELLDFVSEDSQLWISTHSIGLMRAATQLEQEAPGTVAFLDFSKACADGRVAPTVPSRKLWSSILAIALDDLSTLVSPREVVLVEGAQQSRRGGLDADCYSVIFGDSHPQTAFLSVGNADQVTKAQFPNLLALCVPGVHVRKLVDRDARTPREIADLAASGISVLGRRHLESYLFDDEVLIALCAKVGRGDKEQELLLAKRKAMEDSANRGNATDDLKSASGDIYVAARRLLQLTQHGNDVDIFKRDTLAPLVAHCPNVYKDLASSVFPDRSGA